MVERLEAQQSRPGIHALAYCTAASLRAARAFVTPQTFVDTAAGIVFDLIENGSRLDVLQQHGLADNLKAAFALRELTTLSTQEVAALVDHIPFIATMAGGSEFGIQAKAYLQTLPFGETL